MTEYDAEMLVLKLCRDGRVRNAYNPVMRVSVSGRHLVLDAGIFTPPVLASGATWLEVLRNLEVTP